MTSFKEKHKDIVFENYERLQKKVENKAYEKVARIKIKKLLNF